MDQQFWPQISSSFQNTVLQGAGFTLLLIVLALIVLLVVLQIIKRRREKIKESQAGGYFQVSSRKDLSEIFNTALELNSRFDVRLDGQSRDIFCIFREYDGKSLVVEPPAQIKSSKNWIGRDVSVFFKIKPAQDKLSFYKFSSYITDHKTDGDVQLISLAVPEALEMEQKRQHLRIEIPAGYVRDLQVRHVSHNERGNFHRSLDSFGRPIWAIRPDKTKQEIMLMDISGGGVRIRVSGQAFKDKDEFIKNNPSLLISIALTQEKESQEHEIFHLIARTKKHFHDGFGNHVLGMQHEFCAELDESGRNIIGWERVDPENGVEDLITWVVKMHLKLYREKGLV